MTHASDQDSARSGAHMIGPMLVVSSDVEAAAGVSMRNQFGAALAAFLEMYGFGCHETVAPADARAALTRKKWAAAIILNQSDWTPIVSLIDLLDRQTGAFFLEGPISTDLAAAIGVCVAPVDGDDAQEAATAPGRLREHLEACLDGYASAGTISLAPITSTVSRIEIDSSGKKSVHEEGLDSPFHNRMSDLQCFSDGVDETFLSLQGGRAILARKRKAILAGAPLLNLICQRLGVAGLPAPWRRAAGERNGENLDLLILLSLAQTAAANGTPLVSIDPWPDGVAYPVTLRHDVDRAVSAPDWERLLNWQEQAGIRPTWYYLAKTIDQERIAETAARGHEIALHYTNLEKKRRVRT